MVERGHPRVACHRQSTQRLSEQHHKSWTQINQMKLPARRARQVVYCSKKDVNASWCSNVRFVRIPIEYCICLCQSRSPQFGAQLMLRQLRKFWRLQVSKRERCHSPSTLGRAWRLPHDNQSTGSFMVLTMRNEACTASKIDNNI